MYYEKKYVQISAISLIDNTFRITTAKSIKDLKNSLKTVGLINSPLLIKKGTAFIVVSGFRRVDAGRQLGWSSIDVRVASPDTEKIECVQYAITDNAMQRPLNLIETSRSLDLLSEFFQDINRLGRVSSVLGLPGNPAVIKKIQPLCHLPTPIQQYLISGIISLSMALELQDMTPDEAIAFAGICNNLRLSLNNQREILTLLKEIALREGISILNIVEENSFCQTMNDDNMDRTQKTQKIRFYLKKRRFPCLVRAEKEFEALEKKLRIGNDIRLIPPKYFEGTKYSIQFNFSNVDELRSRQQSLDKLIHSPIIKKILDG